MKPRQKLFVSIAAILLVGLLVSGTLVHLLTESWWFDSVGFSQVFWRRVQWQIIAWTVGFVGCGAILWVNYRIAMYVTRYRLFRALAESSTWSPYAKQLPNVVAGFLTVFISLSVAASASAEWETILKFLNASEFGTTDAIFDRDLSFYLFGLPFYEVLQNGLLSIAVISLAIAIAVYAFKGEIGIGRGWTHLVSGGARVHLSSLLAIVAVLLAIGFWLQRYELLYSNDGVVFGAGYTDVNARLPAYGVMSFATIALAVLCVVTLWQHSFALPLFGVVISFLVWIVVGGIYPWAIQSFVVEPNELAKEKPYVANNIEATRQAYGLDSVERFDYPVESNLDRATLEANSSTVDNIRLWDYRPLLSTYRQLQEIRLYYRFSDVDLDRYTLDDLGYRQVMLAPRELSYAQVPQQAKTWVNQRLKYTHGYGLVMSPVNRVTPDGLPEFFIQDIPPVSNISLDVEQPRIYYGEETETYIFTGTTTPEFDYPKGEENAFNNYDGKGGVPMGSWGRRLAYAFDRSSLKILISGYFDSNSRIHYHRQILDRIRTVAPFLRFDGDPYITLIDGKPQWIVEGYTISDRYPYSKPVVRSDNAASLLSQQNLRNIVAGEVNYLRNSVKIAIDAYDGTMQFYVVDETDPVLQTYRNIFPDLFVERSAVSDTIASHFRYPLDLFAIQAQMYLSYHMDNPEVFYNREDLWRFPTEVYEGNQQTVQPYYIIMRLPEESQEEFVLILPFTPVNKDNTIAWMAGRSDGENYGRLLIYDFPKQKLVYGPSQIEARIDQNPTISQQLTLWSQEGSKVIRGDLLVIPIERSLLYVEPVYLRAERGELPELKRVVVAYDNEIVMEPTLEDALDAIFGEKADAPSETAPSPTGAAPEFSDLAQQAQEAYDKAQDALQEGDWSSYGRYQRELGNLLQQLNQ
ncbi:hypothetical protein AY599_23120 [Leptolyngbya valderiana BDU 20041]|nr:UPF0182 family protein [Geitlerinema sp. CS-897]OAB63510.1 hypothetical protein AY599_23120 [Leptolyngbya valderiana BDU 20041]